MRTALAVVTVVAAALVTVGAPKSALMPGIAVTSTPPVRVTVKPAVTIEKALYVVPAADAIVGLRTRNACA